MKTYVIIVAARAKVWRNRVQAVLWKEYVSKMNRKQGKDEGKDEKLQKEGKGRLKRGGKKQMGAGQRKKENW